MMKQKMYFQTVVILCKYFVHLASTGEIWERGSHVDLFQEHQIIFVLKTHSVPLQLGHP